MVSLPVLIATLVLPAILAVSTRDPPAHPGSTYKFCFSMRNIPKDESNPNATLYIENYKMNIGSIPSNQVNAEIGSIYEYYVNQNDNVPDYRLAMFFAGSKVYVGSVKEFSPLKDFSDNGTFKEYKFINRLKNFTGPDGIVTRDGQPTILVAHYIRNNRVTNSTHERLRGKNLKTVLIHRKER